MLEAHKNTTYEVAQFAYLAPVANAAAEQMLHTGHFLYIYNVKYICST